MEEANTGEEQLSLIREVVGLLDAAGVRRWLWGGWGVDFLLGEVSRPHGDIEFVVRERDPGTARAVAARARLRADP